MRGLMTGGLARLARLALCLAVLGGSPAAADHLSGLYAGSGPYQHYSLAIDHAGLSVTGEIRAGGGQPVIRLQGQSGYGGTGGVAHDLQTGLTGTFALYEQQSGLRLDLRIGLQTYSAFFTQAQAGNRPFGGLAPEGQTPDGGRRQADQHQDQRQGQAAAPLEGCFVRRRADTGTEHWLCFDPGGRVGVYEYILPGDPAQGEAGLSCEAPFEARYDGETVTATVAAAGQACRRGEVVSGLYRVTLACRRGDAGLDCDFRSYTDDGTPRGEAPMRMAFVADAQETGPAGGESETGAGHGGAATDDVGLPDF